jgi:hypothetical protein
MNNIKNFTIIFMFTCIYLNKIIKRLIYEVSLMKRKKNENQYLVKLLIINYKLPLFVKFKLFILH